MASRPTTQPTGLNLTQRKVQAEKAVASATPNTPLAIPSTPSDGYDSGVDAQSFISDDTSRVSEYMFSPSDPRRVFEEVMKKSTKDPSVLVGWQISVQGQAGLVIAIKKSLGRSTKFEVKFANGTTSFISLKRSDKKGQVPFTLVQKMT